MCACVHVWNSGLQARQEAHLALVIRQLLVWIAMHTLLEDDCIIETKEAAAASWHIVQIARTPCRTSVNTEGIACKEVSTF